MYSTDQAHDTHPASNSVSSTDAPSEIESNVPVSNPLHATPAILNDDLPIDLLHAKNRRSSIYSRVPETIRKQIDRRLAGLRDSTVTKLYREFKLAELGVSYPAFAVYARNIRAAAVRVRSERRAGPAERIRPDQLADLFAARLADCLADPTSGTSVIVRMARAWSKIHGAEIRHRRLDSNQACKLRPEDDTTVTEPRP